jgi:hypothetical protein
MLEAMTAPAHDRAKKARPGEKGHEREGWDEYVEYRRRTQRRVCKNAADAEHRGKDDPAAKSRNEPRAIA